MNEPKTISPPERLISELLAKLELHVRNRNYVQAMRTIKCFAEDQNAAIAPLASTHKELRQLPVQTIDIFLGPGGVRTVNMLEAAEIKTIGQLIDALKIGRIAGLPNSGEKTSQRLVAALRNIVEQCHMQEPQHRECLAEIESCPGTGDYQQGSADDEDAACG